jgi:hypothetical protein
MISKVPPIPKSFFNRVCKITTESGNIDRYGNRQSETSEYMCKFVQKHIHTLNEDKTLITLEGRALIDGGVSLVGCVGCVFEIGGTAYVVHTCTAVNNPDGSVHHWRLELI